MSSIDLARQVVDLSKACKTPKRDQKLRVGGIYIDLLLEGVNEMGKRLGHKPLEAKDLRSSKFLGKPLTLVEGDVLEVY
jgi:hypothetical protein